MICIVDILTQPCIKSGHKVGFVRYDLFEYFCRGEMAERSNAAVLKTVEVKASGGSNPSLSAALNPRFNRGFFM